MSVATFVPLTNKAQSSVLYLIAILKKLVTAGEIIVVLLNVVVPPLFTKACI